MTNKLIFTEKGFELFEQEIKFDNMNSSFTKTSSTFKKRGEHRKSQSLPKKIFYPPGPNNFHNTPKKNTNSDIIQANFLKTLYQNTKKMNKGSVHELPTIKINSGFTLLKYIEMNRTRNLTERKSSHNFYDLFSESQIEKMKQINDLKVRKQMLFHNNKMEELTQIRNSVDKRVERKSDITKMSLNKKDPFWEVNQLSKQNMEQIILKNQHQKQRFETRIRFIHEDKYLRPWIRLVIKRKKNDEGKQRKSIFEI